MTCDQNWDDWRDNYLVLTDSQQKQYHAYFWKRYAKGNHSFNVPAVIAFLRAHHRHLKRVLEVGGGDGSLAGRMLPLFDIESWANIEFCNEAAASHPATYGYAAFVPPTFRWWTNGVQFKANVLVLSHVLEHFTPEDIKGMLGAINCHYMYVDVPLADTVQKWRGTGCTHVLEMTGPQLVALIESLGYECTYTEQYALAGLVAWFHRRDGK